MLYRTVKTMSGNEINFQSAQPREATQQKSAAPAGTGFGRTQVEAPLKSEPKVSIQDVSRAAAQSKTESMAQISETMQHLDEAIEALNAAVKKVPTSLHFSVDDASKRFVVQVTDSDTGEVIRKVPGDAILRIARQIESLKGVLFDDRF